MTHNTTASGPKGSGAVFLERKRIMENQVIELSSIEELQKLLMNCKENEIITITLEGEADE